MASRSAICWRLVWCVRSHPFSAQLFKLIVTTLQPELSFVQHSIRKNVASGFSPPPLGESQAVGIDLAVETLRYYSQCGGNPAQAHAPEDEHIDVAVCRVSARALGKRADVGFIDYQKYTIVCFW